MVDLKETGEFKEKKKTVLLARNSVLGFSVIIWYFSGKTSYQGQRVVPQRNFFSLFDMKALFTSQEAECRTVAEV